MYKVSIITVCYNAGNSIKQTIESVLNQNYSNIEYIVIDGNSTDDTLDIVNSYGNKINHIVSENDQGLYDAINKGIAIATGDLIGLLHADDFYITANVISDVVAIFESNSIDDNSVYANLNYVTANSEQKIIRKWKSGKFNIKNFWYGWMPPHPTLFIPKSCFLKFGNYRLDFGSAADYELIIRFIVKHKLNLIYLPKTIIHMRVGGRSNKNWENRILANNFDKKAWQANNVKPYWFTLWLKPLRKISQFLIYRI